MTDRAEKILALANDLGVDVDDAFSAVDRGDADTNPVHTLIRDSFDGDDDFDDLWHEIDHATGACSNDDDECMWNDDV